MRPADRITSIALINRAADSFARPARATNETSAAGRALVAAARTPATEPPRPRAADRSRAPFLAHLVATDRGLPQTRLRRRVAPGDAVAAYATAMRGWTGARTTLARVA
jgi:hypothetical protein